MFVGWDYDFNEYGLLSLYDFYRFSIGNALNMFNFGFYNNYLKLNYDDISFPDERLNNLRIIKQFSKLCGNSFIKANDSNFYIYSNGVNKLYNPSTINYDLSEAIGELNNVISVDNGIFNNMFYSGSRYNNNYDDPIPNESRFDPNIVNDDMDMIGDINNRFLFRLVYIHQ